MASELPKDLREREIFLRALREYSERCEPPGLTPDCPFSIETEPGVMGCGEECMDLLGRYKAPRPSEEIDLGRGIHIRRERRPRARHPRRVTVRPYDARELYLEDHGSGPPEQWHLASILYALIQAVKEPPSSDSRGSMKRMEHIDRLIQLVEARGLDFEAHVLPTLRARVNIAVFVNLQGFRQHETMSHTSDYMSTWSSWIDDHIDVEVLERSSEAEVKGGLELIVIMHWAQTARYPSSSELASARRPSKH